MSIPVLIIGKSGSGKTCSLRNCADESFGLISVIPKPLPFRGNLTAHHVADPGKIVSIITKTPKKSVVIDDAGYLQTMAYMAGRRTKKGNASFELYDDIADTMYNLVKFIAGLPETDKIVYMIMHEDKSDFGDIKPRTIGKLLDNKVCLEGMFSIVLRSVKTPEGYKFYTNSDGSDVTKSPLGLFPDAAIDNDLAAIDKMIREYYCINIQNEGEQKNENS